MIDVNEGRTNSYLIHGLIVLAGVCFLFFLGNGNPICFIPGVILFVFAIMVFGGTTGLQIDPKGMKHRKYGKIGGVVFGRWKSLSKIEGALLVKDHEDLRTDDRAWVASSSRSGNSMSTVILTYNIHFIMSESGSIDIYGFNEYRHAKKTLKLIHEQMKIPVVNRVAEKMAANKRR